MIALLAFWAFCIFAVSGMIAGAEHLKEQITQRRRLVARTVALDAAQRQVRRAHRADRLIGWQEFDAPERAALLGAVLGEEGE